MNPKTMTEQKALDALNQYWSDRYQELKEENANLKEKLANRDLNLAHLTELLNHIAEVSA